MNGRNVKWHLLSGDDCLRQLQSNASCGLSRKEARSRFRKYGPNTLFDFPRRPLGLLRRLLTDPALLLLAAVCLLALCFSEISAAIAALVILVGWLALFLRLIFLIQRQRDRLRNDQLPAVTVLRDGKAQLLSARFLVPGDVIFLRAGDIVPADCRLLSATELRVRLTVRAVQDASPAVFEQEKDAQAAYAYGEDVHAPDYRNILYGGAELVNGTASAVVTETGPYTFLGAMSCPVLQDPFAQDARILSGIFPYLRLFGFAVLVLMLPLSIVGLLTAPEYLSTLRVYLPVCALTASASAIIPHVYFYVLLHRQGNVEKGNCGGFLRSAKAFDRLPYLTDVVVLGRSGVSDGMWHLDAASNGAKLFSGNSGESGLQPLCEAFVLLLRAKSQLSQTGIRNKERNTSLISELLAASGYDLQALEVRLTEAVLSADGQDSVLNVKTKDSKFFLRFSNGCAAIAGCIGYEAENGRMAPLEPHMREQLRSFAASAVGKGFSVITVTKEQGGRTVLVGCLSRREGILPHIPEIMRQYRALGVRTRVFADSERASALAFLESCGANGKICRASDGQPLSDAADDCFFAGYAKQEVGNYVRALRRQGRTVAVLSNRMEDAQILSAASLRVACDPTIFLKDNSRRVDGTLPADACSCPPVLRRDADLLVSSASEAGEGGIFDLLLTLRSAREGLLRIRTLLKSLATLQALRVALFALTVFVGIGPIPAYAVLYASLPVDFAVFFLCMCTTPSPNLLATPVKLDGHAVQQFFSDCRLWLVPLISAGALTVLIFILRLSGLLDASEAYPVIFISMLLMQAVLLVFDRDPGEAGFPPVRLAVCCFAGLLVPVAVAVLLSVFIPSVAAVTELGAWSAGSVILLVLSPILSLGSALLFSRPLK